MSFWLISVPHNKSGPSVLAELASATGQLAAVSPFDLPALKVGTLDQLMALSEDTLKMDTFVGGVAKKIEKTYYEMWRTEAAEVAANKEKERILAGAPATSSSSKQEEKAPELRIGDQNSQMAEKRAQEQTGHEFVTSWQWNDVRYPRRSALRTLAEQLMKDASKADEALKKQVGEYQEVRTAHTAIERRDQGTLLVRPLSQYVKREPLESPSLTTVMVVVPRPRAQEFLDSYEGLEAAFAEREAAEQRKKAAEAAERAAKETERREAEAAAAASQGVSAKSAAHAAADAARAKDAAEKDAEAKRLEAEMVDPALKAQRDAEQREKDEEEKKRNKKLPKGCNAVVPRSATTLCDIAGEEFVLFSIVVLRQGAETYRNLLREKRFVVRPFKYDPAEDKAERERKLQLAVKKKNLWNFLIRWCTTTYTEVFTAWVHLKAIRLYVETVLRYGLPFNAQAAMVEPARQKEKQLRDVLRQLYGSRLAGNNQALTTALDPNEPDLSGLGAEFFPWVQVSLNLGD